MQVGGLLSMSRPLRSFWDWGNPPGIVIGDKFTSAGGWFQNAKTKENKIEKEKNTHNLLQFWLTGLMINSF